MRNGLERAAEVQLEFARNGQHAFAHLRLAAGVALARLVVTGKLFVVASSHAPVNTLNGALVDERPCDLHGTTGARQRVPRFAHLPGPTLA